MTIVITKSRTGLASKAKSKSFITDQQQSANQYLSRKNKNYRYVSPKSVITFLPCTKSRLEYYAIQVLLTHVIQNVKYACQ